MPESDAYKKWSREKTVIVTMRLQKSTDADILEFLEGKAKQTEIKKAIRFYIAHHPEEEIG